MIVVLNGLTPPWPCSAEVDLLAGAEVPAVAGIATNPTFSILGHELPLTLAVAVVAAMLGAVFALFNGWVGESLKRMWLRGDRLQLLRAEYQHLELHYGETLRIWDLRGFKLTPPNVRQAIYGQDGLLSMDVAGLASLHPEALKDALQVMGFVRNTNSQLEARAAALAISTDVLSGSHRGALKRRLKDSQTFARTASARLPPVWISVSLWCCCKQILRLVRHLSARVRAVVRGGPAKALATRPF